MAAVAGIRWHVFGPRQWIIWPARGLGAALVALTGLLLVWAAVARLRDRDVNRPGLVLVGNLVGILAVTNAASSIAVTRVEIVNATPQRLTEVTVEAPGLSTAQRLLVPSEDWVIHFVPSNEGEIVVTGLAQGGEAVDANGTVFACCQTDVVLVLGR